MIYGENILSTTPADWTIVDGYMTQAIISLNAGGKASLALYASDVPAIPSQFLFGAIADTYTNSYVADIKVVLYVETSTDDIYEYTVPVIDVKNGICLIEVPTIEVDFTKFTFTISTAVPITFSYWSLSPPSTDDVDLTDIEAKIQKILSDYNTSTYTVGQLEETIALISARLYGNTDVGGKLQLTFNASEACTITLRFKDNDGTELFAPLLFDVNVGKASLGVPHAYLHRLIGLHTFSVTAQCSVGTLTFNVRSILFTVDAGYLATRLMQVSTDIQDIALRQLVTEPTPGHIYAIGIDPDGIIRVRSRVYNENAAIVWTPIYQLEEGTAAAIEFNGTWGRRPGEEFFTLTCEEEPWLFWVDLDGVLHGQIGLNEDTHIELATGVSSVSAVRGYNSNIVVEQDQGLIVAYIKDGAAYYQTYCRQLGTSSVVWEDEIALPQLGIDLTHLQVHRLADYRIGLVASSPTQNRWLITPRLYIAGTVPADTVIVRFTTTAQLAVQEILTYKYPQPTPDTVAIEFNTRAYMNLYEDTDTPVPPVTAFGKIIDERNFSVTFSCTDIEVLSAERLLLSVPLYTIVEANVVDNSIYFKAATDITTLGFTFTLTLGGCILVATNGKKEIPTLVAVAVQGILPEQNTGTVAVSFSIDAQLEIQKITTHSYPCNDALSDTVSFAFSTTAELVIDEISTDPL